MRVSIGWPIKPIFLCFAQVGGMLSKEIMLDFLHPNTEGYKIRAEAIEKKIAELMGE